MFSEKTSTPSYANKCCNEQNMVEALLGRWFQQVEAGGGAAQKSKENIESSTLLIASIFSYKETKFVTGGTRTLYPYHRHWAKIYGG